MLWLDLWSLSVGVRDVHDVSGCRRGRVGSPSRLVDDLGGTGNLGRLCLLLLLLGLLLLLLLGLKAGSVEAHPDGDFDFVHAVFDGVL